MGKNYPTNIYLSLVLVGSGGASCTSKMTVETVKGATSSDDPPVVVTSSGIQKVPTSGGMLPKIGPRRATGSTLQLSGSVQLPSSQDVQQVEVSLFDETLRRYIGSGNTLALQTPTAASDEIWHVANGTSDWSLSVPTEWFSDSHTFRVQVRVTDKTRKVYPPTDFLTFEWDMTPPEISAIDLSPTAADGWINRTESESSSPLIQPPQDADVASIAYAMLPDSAECDENVSFELSQPLSSDKILKEGQLMKVCLRMADAAGNEAFAASESIVKDTVPPSILMPPSALAQVSRVTLNPTVIGASTYLWREEDRPADASSLEFGTPRAATTTVRSMVDGRYRISLSAQDLAGNKAQTEIAIVWSRVPLSFKGLPLSPTTADGYLNLLERQSLQTVVGALDATGYDTIGYGIAPSQAVCDDKVAYGGSAPLSNQAAFQIADGAYKICVRLTNELNRKIFGSSPSFVLDTTPPSIQLGVNVVTNSAFLPAVTAIENEAVAYQWSQVSGPGLALFGEPSQKSTFIGADTDGVYTIRLTATDLAGNSASDDLTLTWDTTPPNISVPDTISATTSRANISATITGATSVRWTEISRPEGTAALQFSSPASSSTDVTAWDDGLYKIQIEAEDALANKQTKIVDVTWTRPPFVFSSLPLAGALDDGYVNASERLTGQIVVGTLLATGYQSAAYGVTGASSACDHTVAYEATPPLTNSPALALNDGSYKICVKLTDDLNRIIYGASEPFVIDTTPPQVMLGSDIVATSTTSAVASVTGTGTFTYLWSQVSGPGAITWGSANATSTSIAANVDGDYIIRFTARDAAGNEGKGEQVFQWDAAPPILQGVTLSGAASDGFINALENSQDLEMIAPSGLIASGYNAVTYVLTSWSTDCMDASLVYSATLPRSQSTVFSAEADYKLCIRLADSHGRTTTGASGKIVLDLTPPSDVSVNPTMISTNVPTTLIGQASDASRFMWSKTSGPGDLVFTSPTGSETLVTASLDGAYTVAFEAVDEAGNSEMLDVVLEWDSTPPSFGSLTLGAVVGDGYLNITEHVAASPIVANLTATGYDQLQYAVTDAHMTCGTIVGYSHEPPLANSTVFDVEGTKKICVKLADSFGNISFGASVPFTVDLTAPTLGPMAPIHTGRPSVVTPNVLGALSYQWTQLNGSAGQIIFGSPNSRETSIAASSDGTYSVRLSASDAAGNSVQGTLSLTWDTTPPTLTAMPLANDLEDGWITLAELSHSLPVLGPLVSDGYTSVGYRAVLADVPCTSSLTYLPMPVTNAFETKADGSYKICVKVSDDAANATYGQSALFTLDKTPPTGVTAGPDIFTQGTRTLLGAASGASSYHWSQVSGPGTLTLADDDTLSPTVTGNTEGTYILRLTVTDVAGNEVSDGMALHIDKTPPTFTGITLSPGLADGWLNLSEHKVSTPLISSLAAAGYASVRYLLQEETATTPACSDASPYLTDAPTQDNALFAQTVLKIFKICVRLTDEAGNVTYAASPTFKVDTVAPSLDVGTSQTSGIPFTRTATSSEIGTYLWSKKSGEGNVTFTAPTSLTTEISADAGSVFALALTARDEAGNTSTSQFNLTWITSGPLFQALPLVGAAADGFINGAETTASGPIVGTLVASNYNTVVYALAEENISCSAVSDFQETVPLLTSVASDGAYKVCVRLGGDGGLMTYGASPTLVRDTLPPSVEAGADIVAGTSVDLNGVVTGAPSYQWTQVGGSGALTLNASQSLHTEVTAPSDGVYTLRLSGTDEAGNTAYDELTLTWDTVPPSFSSLPLAGDASDGFISATEHSRSASIVGSVVASGYTVADYRVVPQTTMCDSFLLSFGSLPTAQDAALETPGDYKVCVRLVDAAGHTSYGASPSFVFDPEAPVLVIDNMGFINASQAESYQVYGSCSESSRTVTVTSGSTSRTTTCLQNEFMATLDFTATLDGPINIIASQSDLAGNSTEVSKSGLVLDTVPPLVQAGGDLSVSGMVTHMATASGAISLAWSKDSGPGVVTFGSGGSLQTTIDADQDGVYTLRLTGIDAAGNGAYSTLTLTRDSLPTQLRLVGPQTASAGDCVGPLSVGQVNSRQIGVVPSAPLAVTLATSGTGKFYSDALCSSPLTSITLTTQSPEVTFYFRSDVAGSTTLTAANAALTSSLTDILVLPGSPSQLVFSTIPQMVSVGSCSGAISVQVKDALGNASPVGVDTAVAFAGLGSASLFLDDSCLSPIDASFILSGQSSATYYVKGGVAETLNLSVTSGALSPGTGTIVIYSGTAVSLSYALPSQLKVLDCVPIKLLGRDSQGAQAPVGVSQTVSLTSSSTSAKFYSNATCTTAVTSIAATASTLGSQLYLMGTAAGTYTLGGQGPSLPIISTPISLKALQWVFSPNSTSISAGACSGPLVLNLHETGGEATTINRALTITLSGTGSGAFYQDDACSQALTSVSWTAGQSLRTLYYKNQRTEVLSLTAATANVTTGQLAMTVTPGSTVAIRLSGPGTIEEGTCYDSYTIYSLDSLGNPSPVTSDTEVTWTGVGQGSFYNDAACTNTISSVRLASGTSVQRLYFKAPQPDVLQIIPAAEGKTSRALTLFVEPESTRSLAMGTYHVCHMARATGAPKCWGYNYEGPIGDGTRTNRWVPYATTLTSGAKKLVAGDRHTCSLLDNGTVKCWGKNNVGQLGIGTTSSWQVTPATVLLPAGIGVKDIASGVSHTCALLVDESLWCWGQNSSGELGIGNTTARATPVAVNFGSGRRVKKLVAGNAQTCVILNDDALTCWGYNADGRMGYGDKANRLTPPNVPINFGPQRWVKDVALGSAHICAILDDDSMRCWGTNGFGQLGLGDLVTRMVPSSSNINFGSERKPKKIHLGNAYTCAVMDNDQATCWGSNDFGKLGVPYYGAPLTPISTPIAFPDGLSVKSLATGPLGHTTCAILANDQTTCWGYNFHGQVGQNNISSTTSPSLTPFDLGTGDLSPQVVVGRSHTCVLGRDGSVRCFGNNLYGQCGYSAQEQGASTRIHGINLGAPATAVAAGADHSCAIVQGGGITCWGLNSFGQLGGGTTGTFGLPTPVIMPAGKQAQSISLGVAHSCAVMTDGTAYCWGNGIYGGLGYGATTSKYIPTKVAFPSDVSVKKITAGNYWTCAILGDDTAKCWGYNNVSQLGLGTTTNRLTPGNAINTGVAVVSINAGLRATCLVLADQTTRCYGSNTIASELGTSTSGGLLNMGTGRYAVEIVGSLGAQCAILDDGTMKCWGYGANYQLGTGLASNASTPTANPINFGTKADGTPLRVLSAAISNHTCAILDDNTVRCLGLNNVSQQGYDYRTYWVPPSSISSLNP